MTNWRHKKILPVLTAAALLSVAGPAFTAGEHDGGHGGDGHGNGHDHDGGHAVEFGEPAPAARADRIIRVTATDTMAFSPESVAVESGETITFVVENVGRLPHSFTLGTPSGQRAHEEEMQGMPMEQMAGHMADDPTGMVLQAGETGKLTWHFTQDGPVEFACHIPGHYPAGMKGRIRIR